MTIPFHSPRRPRRLQSAAAGAAMAAILVATAGAQSVPPPPPDRTYIPPPAARSFAPQGLALLARNAAFHTDVTFDRSMLSLAANFTGMDEPTRQAVARLNSITLHTYRFAAPGMYSLAALDAVRAQYNALGWKHIVTAGAHQLAAEGVGAGRTDVWVRMDGASFAGAAVLLVDPKDINLISIDGRINTLDLLHLRGHFGIPRFSANALPPQPGPSSAPPCSVPPCPMP